MDAATSAPQVLAGQALRMMRELHQVSLRSLAADIGISPGHLSRVESGERPATAELTERICAAIADLPAPREVA